MGWSIMPGWFAIGALPVLHAAVYSTIVSALLPMMENGGLSSVQAFIQARSGHLLEGDRLALAAVFCSLLLHLGTFYPFLFVSSFRGVDNQTPRKSRPADGSLAGRLYACHLNQAESFPYFAAAVLAAVVLGKGAAVASLAWIHIGFRVAYFMCYAGNLPNLRTFVFCGSFHCSVLAFAAALRNP